jgi:hypothetical protein
MISGRTLLTIALACVFGCTSKREPAKDAAAAQPEPTPHAFLGAVIQSLARSQRGLKMVNDAAAAKSSMVDMMTANQNAAVEIRIAESFVEPYASSRDENRRESAQGILGAYKMYERSLAIQLAGFEAIDSASTPDALRGMSRGASDGRVAYQQGSALLIDAVTLAFGSVLVHAPDDTSHMALDMSAGERRALVAETDSLMGRMPSNLGDAPGPVAAAGVLRKALNQGLVAR